MAEIYLLRHGESTRNREDVVGGQSNECELTEVGVSQSQRAGLWLAHSKIIFDHFVSSTAVRARRTLDNVLSQLDIPFDTPTYYTDLLEMSQGIAEGKPRRTIYTPEVVEQIKLRHFDFAIPGGESIRQVGMRTLYRLKKLAADDPDGTFLVVGHGLSFRSAIGLEQGWSHKKIISAHTPNCSLTHISIFDNEFQLHSFGEDVAETLAT